MKTVIATTAAPAAIGPYCQAVKVGNMLFTSGQIPIDPATSQFVEGGIKEQTAQVFANLKAVLAEAGYTFDDSTAVVNGQFIGLPIDNMNEDDQTPSRIDTWILRLKQDGLA